QDLGAVSDFCNRNIMYDKFTPALIDEKSFSDPDFDPALTFVAKDVQGNIIGFLLGNIRVWKGKPIGWIKLMAVEESLRRKQIGSEMLKELEMKLKSLGVIELKVMDCPMNYYMPGVDPRYTEMVVFCLRRGFNRIGENINMDCDLVAENFDTTELEAERKQEGFELKRAEPTDKEATLRFVNCQFGGWENEIATTFKNNPISLHIAKKDNEIVAFSAYDGNNIGLGWFGPMGTNPNLRGKKIGEILLKRCLADQKKQGYKISIIPWVGPISFYLNTVNAKIGRVFWTFQKNL
ncbi:MAG: GNAT family N-acetyltransferase, partial [bacterium]|nr:GNAT family N-acetyltransferase [bacterium]